jgi:hypothetical protein
MPLALGLGESGTVGIPLALGRGESGIVGMPLDQAMAALVAATAMTVITRERNLRALEEFI